MRRGRARLAVALAGALAALLLVAAVAVAAETIGPESPNPSPSTAFAAPYPSGTLLFADSGPSGDTWMTPSAGKITSWRLYTGEVGTGATAQLYAMTVVDGSAYSVAAIGPKEALPAVAPTGSETNNVLHTFSSELEVPAEALLGVRLEYPSDSTLDPVYYLGSGWETACLGGNCPAIPASGSSADGSSYVLQVAMNESFEPSGTPGPSGGTTTCLGNCGASTTTTSTPVSTSTKTTAVQKKVTCKKGKKLVKGRCVKKKSKRKHHVRHERNKGKKHKHRAKKQQRKGPVNP